MDRFVDTSGLAAIAGHRSAAHLTVLSLRLLQDRGVAGAAVAVTDSETLRFNQIQGQVDNNLEPLAGTSAIGQVFGRVEPEEIIDGAHSEGMICAHQRGGPLAIAVHGRFTNGHRLRRELVESGATFFGGSDAELLLQLIAASDRKTFMNRLVDALWRVEGGYSALLLSQDHLVAVRDPSGFRPLVLGRWDDALVIATDDGPIRFLGGEVRREIRPGEMLVCNTRATPALQSFRSSAGPQSIAPFPARPRASCVQEFISLARGDSAVFGFPARTVRLNLGARLAAEHPCPDADIVCGLPGDGEAVAMGYARALGLPYEPAFLPPAPSLPGMELRSAAPAAVAQDQSAQEPSGLEDLGERLRWRVVPSVVEGRAVVLVAPMISTGKLLALLVRQLTDAGAHSVHVRIASPPAIAPCPYGIASPIAEELLLVRAESDPARALVCDSFAALSSEALQEIAGDALVHAASELGVPAVPPPARVTGTVETCGLCDACLSGRQPIVPERIEDQLPLF